MGVNGSGKTTSIAKLATVSQSQGKNVVLGAGDTFRAAAVEQLGDLGRAAGLSSSSKAPPGSDPASVAHRAVAQRRGARRRRLHHRHRRPAANADTT